MTGRRVYRGPPGPRRRAKMAREKAERYRDRGNEAVASALERYAAATDAEADARKAAESAWSEYLRILTGRKDV